LSGRHGSEIVDEHVDVDVDVDEQRRNHDVPIGALEH